MANVAIFRSNQLPQYLTSVHTTLYESDPDVIINPDVSALTAVPLKYWKRNGNLVQEQSAAEKTTTDAGIAAALQATNRSGADTITNAATIEGVELRAFVGVLVDELNILRQWTRDFKTEVAAATSLANLQARVATLATLNDRTLAQAKTAYQNKISSGSAD